MRFSVPLLECVPNVSEGRDQSLIRTLADAANSVPGASLLFVDSNPDANRTVFTLAGTPDATEEAMFRLAREAVGRIDMRQHLGVHSRLGAVDVVPFVPLGGLEMSVAVVHAKSFGQRFFRELGVPVYWYEECAETPERKALPYVRGRGYASLPERYKTASLLPDLDTGVFHHGSGATVIGAREVLIAYNINLATKDVEIAKRIAQQIRTKKTSGQDSSPQKCIYRLPALRAIGWYMEEYSCAQVSMNLLDYRRCGLYEVFEACSALAQDYGTEVCGSELIGMLPQQALLDVARRLDLSEEEGQIDSVVEYLGLDSLREFKRTERILEQQPQLRGFLA